MNISEVLQSFCRRSVLVTGGTGLIGRQVVDALVGAGALVKVVSLDSLALNSVATYVVGDLRDFTFCKTVVEGSEFVVHLAGVQGNVQTSSSHMASHFIPTLMVNTNVLESCRINQVKRLVYTSSIGAYAEGEILREDDYRIDSVPVSFAGWAKRMAEQQIHAYHIQYGLKGYVVVRPSNVYGPGDNFDPVSGLVISALMARIHAGENPLKIWGDGRAIRDFVFSRDVAEGVILALFHGTSSPFLNLGGGVGHSIREVAETLKTFIPFDFEFDTTRPSGVPKRVLEISKARQEIGYDPSTTLLQGLQETWEWFRQHPTEHEKKVNYYRD